MANALVRALVGVLGVVTAMSVIACQGDLGDTDEVGEADAAITMDDLVLVGDSCVSDLPPGDAARVEHVEQILGMTASQRVAAGVKKMSTSALPSDQRRALAALAGNPCEVEGEITCVSGTSDNGTHWAMCTDGIVTCGATSAGLLLFR